MKALASLVIFLALFAFSFDVYCKVPDDVIAGRKSDIVVTLVDELSMPYMGQAEILPSGGELLSENPVEFDMGSVILKYKAPDKAGEVRFEISVEGEMPSFSVEVLPDYTSMKSQYFEIAEFGGHVSMERKGKNLYEGVSSGEKLFEGDRLQVLKESYAILEGPGGNRIEIAPNSMILVEKVRSDSKTVFIRIEVIKGEVVSRVTEELFNTVLLLDGKSVTAGVRGTILGMEVSSDEVDVRNFEGKVWVKAAGEFYDLPRMKMMRFGKNALVQFERVQKETMERFERMEREIMKGFEQRAKQLLSTFGMEEMFRIDMRDFTRPIDKNIKSFDEMINGLRKKWRKRNGKGGN